MFLSQSTDFLDMLYYEADASHFSSVLFYYLVSLVVALMVMLIVLIMVHSSSIMCCHLSCEIRREALNRERGREIEISKMLRSPDYISTTEY